MPTPELDSAAAVCLLAAMADGAVNPREQEHVQHAIRVIADAAAAMGGSPGGSASGSADVYQRVMLGQTDLSRETANIASEPLRRQVYELATAICAADGATSGAERDFLSRLARELKLDAAAASQTLAQADQLAGAAATALAPASPASTSVPNKEIDDMILNASILNGALELLPQSLASMAIIPLQMRLVYRIGARHGHTLDRGHITEFLGVLGVGATSQIIESVAGRLLGGLLKSAGKQVFGKTVGGLAGSLGRTAGSAAMSFATTYAMGQVARQYYAGGRTLSAVDLRAIFNTQIGQAQSLATRYLPQIQSRAQSISPSQLVSLARGEIGA